MRTSATFGFPVMLWQPGSGSSNAARPAKLNVRFAKRDSFAESGISGDLVTDPGMVIVLPALVVAA
jgi:hypothetical protein